MKATKNAVLKCSPYTAALTRSLKSAERLHCRLDAETNSVYVCNGYLLAKLNPAEYDALVRPVTQREAGNFVLYNGEEDAAREPLDLEKLLTDAAREAAHELTPAPFLVDPCLKRTKSKIIPYYSESGDFVAGFNSDYAAIISAGLPRRSKDSISPMVVFIGDEPQAMILPVRFDETKSRVPAAVRAYFTEKPQEAPAQVPQEQTPAGKAAALVEKLADLEGIAATIKGAQTAAPVVWLSGDADAHKEKIEKLGGKWSGKRSAWYFKIA